jgi:hypothetical protein
VRHRFDHRGKPATSVEDVGLLDGGGSVEPPAGSLQQPFDDVAVLPLAGRLVEGKQSAAFLYIGDPVALDEHLLDVMAGEQSRERAVLGERPPNAVHHVVRLT